MTLSAISDNTAVLPIVISFIVRWRMLRRDAKALSHRRWPYISPRKNASFRNTNTAAIKAAAYNAKVRISALKIVRHINTKDNRSLCHYPILTSRAQNITVTFAAFPLLIKRENMALKQCYWFIVTVEALCAARLSPATANRFHADNKANLSVATRKSAKAPMRVSPVQICVLR